MAFPENARNVRPLRQTGVFVVLFPLVVIALFGLIGLTLTSGNTFVDRTKLQNLLDSMALSAATQVNTMNANRLPTQDDKCQAPHANPPNGILGVGQALLNAFDFATVLPGNQPLEAAINGRMDFIVEYATQLNTDAFSVDCPRTDPAQPIYVRIRLKQPMQTPEFMLPIIGPWLGGPTYDIRVSGSAVAGPAPVTPIWTARRCPVPAFLCDRSNPDDLPHAPTESCKPFPNGADCSFGYPKNAVCSLPVTTLPIQASICSELQGELQTRSLQVVTGFDLAQALSGMPGACPLPPDQNGQVLTVTGTLPIAELGAGLAHRLNTKPPGMVVPVLDCSSASGSLRIAGYLCFRLSPGDLANQVRMEAIDSGIVPGGCGASMIIGGSRAIPPVRADGLPALGNLWRIVLYRDPGARDS